jgi:hypothetical protein
MRSIGIDLIASALIGVGKVVWVGTAVAYVGATPAHSEQNFEASALRYTKAGLWGLVAGVTWPISIPIMMFRAT